jgi:RNA polymerase sigma-70 factor (ECF subfamily)
MKRDSQSTTQGAPPRPQPPDSGAETLTSLYQRWRAPLVRLFQGRSHNRAQAEDAAQDVFVRMAVSGKRLAPEEEKPYLSTVARSVATDAWRKNVRGTDAETVSMDCACGDLESIQADEALSPMEIAAHRQRINRLNDAVSELPERQRQAFLLNRIDGLTHDEVAAAMGISARMVSKHLHRAMAYCQLRMKYASVEQMQILHTAPDPREECAAEREDAP